MSTLVICSNPAGKSRRGRGEGLPWEDQASQFQASIISPCWPVKAPKARTSFATFTKFYVRAAEYIRTMPWRICIVWSSLSRDSVYLASNFNVQLCNCSLVRACTVTRPQSATSLSLNLQCVPVNSEKINGRPCQLLIDGHTQEWASLLPVLWSLYLLYSLRRRFMSMSALFRTCGRIRLHLRQHYQGGLISD